MYCFESFIKMLSNNAYTYIQMTNQNYFPSCRKTFFLMLRNFGRFMVVDGIGLIIVSLGMCFICAITSIFGYDMLTNVEPYKMKI